MQSLSKFESFKFKLLICNVEFHSINTVVQQLPAIQAFRLLSDLAVQVYLRQLVIATHGKVYRPLT